MDNYTPIQNPVKPAGYQLKLVSLICLVIIAGFTILNYFTNNKVTSTITVNGESKTVAKADSVSLVATRVNSGTGIALAIDDGENGINTLVNTAKKLAGSTAEIKKTFYQVTSQTNGYSVANAISIKSTNVKDVSTLIKELYANGATSVSNVTFESTDLAGVEQKARTDAFKDAQEKAKRMAKSAGKRLGKVLSITDDNTGTTSTVKDLKTNDGTSISISKNVSVVYEIK